MPANLLFILAGLVLLYFGADWLVRGAAALARRLGLTPLAIGLTVVAYGTSLPELVVTTRAALGGAGDLALGNVIGSNICNVGLILGVAAMISPLVIRLQILKFDVPILIAASLLLVPLLGNGRISRVEGALLFAGILAYTAFNLWQARKEHGRTVLHEYAEAAPQPRHPAVETALVLGGLAALLLGGQLLLHGAVGLARSLGVSEAVIGLTVVAVGTSFPELAATVLAAHRGQSDIAVGNVVGSCIFNLLNILGLSSLVSPLAADEVRGADLAVMIAFALVLAPMMGIKFVIKRWEGALLLAGYAGYLVYLWPA